MFYPNDGFQLQKADEKSVDKRENDKKKSKDKGVRHFIC